MIDVKKPFLVGVNGAAVALCAALYGCVSSPGDALNLGGTTLPPPPANAQLPSTTQTTELSQPGARKSGNYPKIGIVPTAQTTQMTPAEKAALKRDLASGQNRTSAEQAQAAQTTYEREVAAMRKLVAEQQARIKAQDF